MKPHDAKQKEMKKRHTNKKRARSESNHHAEMLMEINLRVHPLRFLHDTCQIDMYLWVRIDTRGRNSNFDEKTKTISNAGR